MEHYTKISIGISISLFVIVIVILLYLFFTRKKDEKMGDGKWNIKDEIKKLEDKQNEWLKTHKRKKQEDV